MDTRKQIYDLVSRINPFDELELAHQQDTLAWIASGVEIIRLVKPATPPKHIVVMCLVFDSSSKKLLLFDHILSELLLPSGGHLDINELPVLAARREPQEEVNLQLEILNQPQQVPFFISQTVTVGKALGHTDVGLWYLFKGDEKIKIDDQAQDFQKEFSGYNWYALAEILQMKNEQFDPNFKRLVHKIMHKF